MSIDSGRGNSAPESSPLSHRLTTGGEGKAAQAMRRPLSWRAELGRQLRRRRTIWSFVLLAALPLVLVGGFAFGRSNPGPPTGARLADLAQLGAANFAMFAVFAAAEFLLVVLAALFAGDAVPSEASWATLRYLLVAPVSRARLLTSKLVVAMTTTAAAVVLIVGWSLLVGLVAYGAAPFTNPVGGVLGWDQLWPRLAVATAYELVTLWQVAAIAFWLGTRTDAPLAAVGGAVLVTIIASILGQIESLGEWRNALPMPYNRAWLDLFNATIDWTSMRRGALWSCAYAVLFLALAFRTFRRKDILS
jgi:ABC-2 type transport system permease protein